MPYKVTKKGKVPPKLMYSHRGKCLKCGCEFSVDGDEVRSWGDVRDNDGGYIATCPTKGCGYNVDVTRSY
jgi:hypothetical protein